MQDGEGGGGGGDFDKDSFKDSFFGTFMTFNVRVSDKSMYLSGKWYQGIK